MLTIKEPVFIHDPQGNPVAAVLDIDSYYALIDAIEDAEDIRLAEEAAANPDPHPLPMDEAFLDIERMVAERASV